MASRVISQDQPISVASTGFADVIGFGVDGVYILRNGINIQSYIAIKHFGYNAGWRIDKHIRLLGDMTGGKEADVIGFGEDGVFVSFNAGNNRFALPVKVLNDFAYNAGGWRVEKHIRYVADIRNIGRSDIVGFGGGGVLVSRNIGNGRFNPVYLALNDFGYNAGGWRLDRHLRFLADATGDGLLDIVGFGESHVFIGRNKGDGTFASAQAVVDNFCYSAGGWRIKSHPRFLADLTGDGRVDIIGCGGPGVYVSLNNGNGSFGPLNLVVNNFGTQQGWKVSQHPRFVADLTGNKRGDVIGFGSAGVYVSLNNGDGTFQPTKLVVNNFGVQQGWDVQKHPRFVVDLTGDGCADIIGFGKTSVFVSFNDGNGNFGPAQGLLNAFAYNGGQWSMNKTVRYLVNLDQRK